jgi:hypothetical protein
LLLRYAASSARHRLGVGRLEIEHRLPRRDRLGRIGLQLGDLGAQLALLDRIGGRARRQGQRRDQLGGVAGLAHQADQRHHRLAVGVVEIDDLAPRRDRPGQIAAALAQRRYLGVVGAPRRQILDDLGAVREQIGEAPRDRLGAGRSRSPR